MDEPPRSACPYGHGDCALIASKNQRIAALVDLNISMIEDPETIATLRAKVAALTAEVERLRRLGPNPLRGSV